MGKGVGEVKSPFFFSSHSRNPQVFSQMAEEKWRGRTIGHGRFKLDFGIRKGVGPQMVIFTQY